MTSLRDRLDAGIDRLKSDRETQFSAFAVVFFLLAFPAYFSYAANNVEAGGFRGVDTYTINGDLIPVLLAEGTEYVGDGDTVSLSFDPSDVDWGETGRNVVAVRLTMEYSEDETSAGVGCASPLTGGSVQADSITGTVLRDEYNGTATGQNQAQGTSSHEVLVEWYNASLLDTTVSDRSEGDLVEELEGGTTGLGTYLIDLEVQVQSGGGAGCTYTDDGEEIAYRVELLVLNYQIDVAESTS